MKGAKIATMVDVASRAGVSTSTVSHVINQTRYVSEEVTSRVHEAMEELNYQPNVVARSLRTRESRIIGVVVSDVTNPFFTASVRAIEDEAITHRYNIILCDTDEKPRREAEYLNILFNRRVDGLIVSPSLENADLIASMVESGTPIVLLDREIPGLDVDVVGCDNEGGAYEAVTHLIDCGHRRIGIIAGRLEVSTGAERMAGYERALREHDIPIDEALTRSANFSRSLAYQKTTDLLKSSDPPSALFVCNNTMTLGALAAMSELGLKVPDDVSVVGFDDTEWAALMDPPLTVVSQPVKELGTKATEILIRRIRAGSVKKTHKLTFAPELIVRASCRNI